MAWRWNLILYGEEYVACNDLWSSGGLLYYIWLYFLLDLSTVQALSPPLCPPLSASMRAFDLPHVAIISFWTLNASRTANLTASLTNDISSSSPVTSSPSLALNRPSTISSSVTHR